MNSARSCFLCQKPGHLARDCHNNRNVSSQPLLVITAAVKVILHSITVPIVQHQSKQRGKGQVKLPAVK